MADKEDTDETEETAEESGGGKKKLILIIVGALLLIGVATGGALMFLGGESSDAEVEVVEDVLPDKGSPAYVDLKPPFTVNLDPQDPVGFLQISLQVLTYDDGVADELEKHKPLIRNNLVLLFGKQKSVDLREPEGKDKLQKSALETVQQVINQYGSGGEVDNVFFTSFVMQ
jgi:flagellar FliL protein